MTRAHEKPFAEPLKKKKAANLFPFDSGMERATLGFGLSFSLTAPKSAKLKRNTQRRNQISRGRRDFMLVP